MKREAVETVVIGAGQAGLTMSAQLTRLGRPHLVLERGRIAERWRSERWDSLRFQFPNWLLRLPDFPYAGDPDGFAGAADIASFIAAYAEAIDAPVRTGVEVRRLSAGFVLETSDGQIEAANVVVATGPYQRPIMPEITLPARITALPARDYRNPDALPPGGVLVVGSGGSGCQIAEDLVRAGRRTWLSVGTHRRVPRRYRGRDFAHWETALGEWDRPVSQREPDDRAILLTGVDGGRDMEIRALAAQGVVLAGRLDRVDGQRAWFRNDLAESLARGDAPYARYLARIDALIEAQGLAAPPPDPVTPPPCPPALAELDLAEISTVIWCTGYGLDFGWIDLPVLKADGAPIHTDGVSNAPGLYFLGLPWLSRRKSTLLAGVGDDAARLAEHLAARGA